MTDRGPAALLAEFARQMPDQDSVQDVLQRLGDYCTELLPVRGIGVLIRDGIGLTVATWNTPEGEIVERIEAEEGEGPCVECASTGEQILEPDLAAARDRYPNFVPRALESGVRAIYALPMTARGEAFGALDIVALEPGTVGSEEIRTVQLLADVASSYLVNVQAVEEATELAGHLQQALDSRVVIEQAKGMLAERHGIGVEEAFEKLRRSARSSRESLHAVATKVLSSELDI